METYLQKIIREALLKLGLSEEQLPNIKIETPKDPSHGDASTNVAMVLPKILKKNPRAIAEELITQLESDSKKIKAIEIAGPGFINFRFAERITCMISFLKF